MNDSSAKQLVLKPQDLVLAIKIAVNNDRTYLLVELASALCMAVSAVHASMIRCEKARFVSRASGTPRAFRASVQEFLIHGAKYAFPGNLGAMSRGVPTSIAGPSLRSHFESPDLLAPVWPDANGTHFGPSLLPLYPAVPAACAQDVRLFDVLTLFDALRVGAARERALAVNGLMERLS